MRTHTMVLPPALPAVCAATYPMWQSIRESIVVTAAPQRIQMSRVHQVLAMATAGGTNGYGEGFGTTGLFAAGHSTTEGLGSPEGLRNKATDVVAKRAASVASGVPPRGRPV